MPTGVRFFVGKRSQSATSGRFEMKEAIHPKFYEVTATCVCGNTVEIGSTKQSIRVEICSSCHPYYTGTQKIIDTEGRVDRFVKRYQTKEKAAKA